MLQYPKSIDALDDEAKTIFLAEEFCIPHTIETGTESNEDWGGLGTYDVDYVDFDMTYDELEKFVNQCLSVARLFVMEKVRHRRNK